MSKLTTKPVESASRVDESACSASMESAPHVEQHACSASMESTLRVEQSTCSTAAKRCRSSYYALAFILPFAAVAGIGMLGGDLSVANVAVAAIAGACSFAAYAAVKYFRHCGDHSH